MIQEISITSIDALIRVLNELPNSFVYRGHSDSTWRLQSTLERVLGNKWSAENARKFEEYSINTFTSKYHIYKNSEHTPKSKLSWLSIMQHYGAPTRLIDFTASPYIALYFALETYDPLSKKNLAIFAVDYSAIMDRSIDYIKGRDSKFSETRNSIQTKQDEIFDVVDRFSHDIVWVTEPCELNARIDRQSGTFLIAGNREKTIDSIISSDLYKENCPVYKYIISHELYEGVFALLRKMSINAKAIYGDLSGLARSIKMELQVYTA